MRIESMRMGSGEVGKWAYGSREWIEERKWYEMARRGGRG